MLVVSWFVVGWLANSVSLFIYVICCQLSVASYLLSVICCQDGNFPSLSIINYQLFSVPGS